MASGFESTAFALAGEESGLNGARSLSQNDLFENAFHYAPIGLALVDLDGRLMKINRSFCEIIGYDETEALSLDFQTISYADDLPADLERLRRLTNGEIPNYTLDKRYIRKDGSLVWASLSVSMVVDAAGRPKHYIAQVTDLTERRRAAVALTSALEAANNSAREARAAEKTLSSLVRAIPISVAMTDRYMRVLKVSPSWLQFFGCEEAEVLGHDLCQVLDGYYSLFKPVFDRAMGGEIVRNPRRRIEWKGRVDWAQTEVAPWMTADGEVGGILITAYNITGLVEALERSELAERAAAEARDLAEAANRSKSEFLANMSHEIRTPLNGILGMAQVIEQDELTYAQRQRIKVVRESGVTLLGILNDVLDLSKIQAGKLELEPSPFDIDDLAPVVTAAFAGSAAAKDITLDVEIADSARGVWVGDILRLRQVLSNLVSNALKFTSEGGVTLHVRHDGHHLAMAVQDTGIGIAADKIASLFEKFSQEDASTTRRYGGTGLGLSICRELVELMGGRIEVESEKGVGSCFSVFVPLVRGEKTRGPAPARREQAAHRDSPVRVLAAEDNPTNQLVLRALLASAGVELTLVNNGVEAVEAFKAGVFDLVLMDIQMPVMNGVEATLIIRAMEADEGRVRTPILSLSANAMTHQIEDYAAAGMDGSVAKPIEMEKLYAAMDEALAD